MSTTATVSVVEDGKVTMTHVYQNGFPEALGKKLKEDYGDLTKVLGLAEGDKIVFDNIDAWKSVQPASEYNYVFAGGKWLLYSPAGLIDLDCKLDKDKLREAAGAAVSAIGGEFSDNQDAIRLRIQLDSGRFINFNLEDQILNYKIADNASLPFIALTGIIKGLETYAVDRQCNFEESDVPTIAALSDLLFQVTGFDRAKYQDLTVKQNMMEYFIYRVCGEEGKDLAKALERSKKGYAVKKIDKLADSLGLSLKKKIQELAGVDGWLYFSNVYAMVHQYRRNMRTFGKGWVDMLEEIKKDSHYQKAEELLAKEKEVVNRKFEGSLKQLQCVSVKDRKDRKEKGKSIMNRALSAAAKAALAIALFGGASQTVVALPSAVLASKQYSVKVTKKTFVYNAKGKKTKKYYKKNASLKAFGIKAIKGKKYYILGKGRYIRTSNAKKAGETKYHYGAQTKKISRTIKMYTPKGVKKVIQKAYIKRTVKTNKKTGKKTYGKWSTSSWKKYKPVKFKGYTASKETVKAAKVTSKTKNKTVKITYKLVKKTAPKKTNTKPAAKPSTTPSQPTNSGASKPATKPSQPANTGGNSHSGNATTPSQPTNTSNTGNTNGGSTNTGSTAPSQPTNGGASTNTPSQPTNSGNTGNSGNTTPNQPTNGGNSNTGNSGTTAPSQPTNSSNTGNTNSGSGTTAPSQPTNSGNTGNANSSSGTTAPSQPASKPSQPTNSGSTNTGNSGNTGSGTTTPSQPTNGGSTNTGSTGNAGTSQPVQPQKPASGNTGNTNSGSGSTAPSQPAEPVKTAPADKVTTANVAYRTVYQADPSMDAGTKKTLQAGQTGVDTTTTSYNVDGSVKSTSTVRTKNPVDQVVAVGTKTKVSTEMIAYKYVEKADPTLAKGEEKLISAGHNGEKITTTTYTLDTATGLVTPHVDVKTTNPVDAVLAIGTKEAEKPAEPTAPADKVTTAAVAYKTVYQADPSLDAGTKKVLTSGQTGVDTTTVKYNNDGSVKSTNTVRTKEAVNQVVAVGTKSVVKSEVLSYKTVEQSDNSLVKGTTKVVTKGVNGSKTTTTTYTLDTVTGEVTPHVDVKTKNPVDEVVAVGTAVAPEDKVTTKAVSYKTVYIADDTMAAGTKKTVTAGQAGVDTATVKYNLDGSVKSSSTVRTKNPVDEVVAVGTKSVVKSEILSYKYIEKEDPTLAKGEEKLISAGYNGKKVTTTTYTLDTATGEVTAHTDVKTIDPVDAVLAVGTKEAPADLVTTAPVAYKTIYQANNDLDAGTKMVLTKGENGVDTTTTTYNLDGSVKSSLTVRTKNPVDQVVAVGTKTEVSTEILQYKSVTKEDPTLKKGTTQKVKGGINGWATTTTTYTLDTATGEVTAHKSVEKVDPVDEVISIGTAEANPYTAEKIAQLKPMLLALVNQYRAEVGADPLTMDSTYDTILDARAAQKAKDEGTTGTYNHSGFSDLPDALNKEEATDGYVHGGESLGVGQFSLYASDEDQFAGILNYEKMTEDDEKADYQAIVIDKSRDYFKGPSQTYRHYTMMVDKKNTKVYIGVGTYVDENEDGWISVVFEFKP